MTVKYFNGLALVNGIFIRVALPLCTGLFSSESGWYADLSLCDEHTVGQRSLGRDTHTSLRDALILPKGN
ncbi:hypothetical protein TcasGA2_TC007597 [Tribolium castaneum]|uniref:Uncharacterized protein n=1 Tax=Tribolium castaneum TaxID=7070 RepID=D2A2Z9_TRICA|nr:hypothetical protein TcasGA2_TC007597 [Tribolium castaneum]